MASMKDLRKKRGLSQKELAEKCGLKQSFISEVENGKKRPSLDNAKRIAKALGVKLHILF